MSRNWQERQGNYKTDKKDTGAATGQDWCFGSTCSQAWNSTSNWRDTTGWIRRAAEREGCSGAMQDMEPVWTSPRVRDSTYTCMFKKRTALNYCRETCPIIPPKLMVPALSSSTSVVKSMS